MKRNTKMLRLKVVKREIKGEREKQTPVLIFITNLFLNHHHARHVSRPLNSFHGTENVLPRV